MIMFWYFFLARPWGWMDPLKDFPSQFCAGCSRPAVLCSTGSDVRDGVWCEMLSHSAAVEQGSVYSNSEKQIGNRISPNRHLIFQKWPVVMGCTAEQTPQFILSDFTLDKHSRWDLKLASPEHQAVAGSLFLSGFTRNNILVNFVQGGFW